MIRAEGEDRIESSKTERVRESSLGFGRSGAIGYDVQVTLRVRAGEIRGWRQEAVPQRAVGLRCWVIRVMREHWNVQILASMELGVVTGGPFRWVRHPNYVAVFVELMALPLLHTAWCTALAGTMIHYWVLKERIRVEEATLLSSPAYVALMGSKPRFVPLFFRGAMQQTNERPAQALRAPRRDPLRSSTPW